MNKDLVKEMLRDYSTRFIINSQKSGIVVCNTSNSSHIYFACEDISNYLNGVDSFKVYDTDKRSKLICEYSKENDTLLFMDSVQYRKVILAIMTEQGLYVAEQVIKCLNDRNIKCDDSYFLDLMEIGEVLDRLFNAPLNRKPSIYEEVKSIKELDLGHYIIERGNNSKTEYTVTKFKGSKENKKKQDNVWYQLGFEVVEHR